MANGRTFSKADNLAKYTQIFENFSLEVLVSFDFAPRIFGIFDGIVHISEVQQFSDFPETLPGNVRIILNGKRPFF